MRALFSLAFMILTLLGWSQINLLSWNVQMRPTWLFPFGNQISRSTQISDYIQKFDVVVLQEVFEKKCYDNLSKKFDYIIQPSKSDGKATNGLLILSRYKIDYFETIYFDLCKSFDCLSDKGATLFQITIDSIKYQIINTHLQSGDGEKNDFIRKSQINQISQLMNKYYLNGVRQILMGDLNQSDGAVEFEKILNLNNCNSTGCSWYSETKTKLLDYVLTNFELDAFSIGDIKLSDHYPIQVVIY